MGPRGTHSIGKMGIFTVKLGPGGPIFRGAYFQMTLVSNFHSNFYAINLTSVTFQSIRDILSFVPIYDNIVPSDNESHSYAVSPGPFSIEVPMGSLPVTGDLY